MISRLERWVDYSKVVSYIQVYFYDTETTLSRWIPDPLAMRLTQHTDFALRILLYLCGHRERLCTVVEIADYHRVSQNHLVKVAQALNAQGWVETVRGRGGGLRLAVDPTRLGLGDVIRKMEPGFALVTCFEPQGSDCPLASGCGLAPVLDDALAGFFDVLDRHTLADIAHGHANKHR